MYVALLTFSLVLQGVVSLNIPRIPSRPVLPNSFSFNATLDYYGGTGKASYGTNFETGNAFLKIELPTDCDGYFSVVIRNDHRLMYSAMKIGDVFECFPIPVLSSKPTEGVFDWLKTAEYEGQSTEMVAGLTLDIWKSTTSVLGEGIFRLGVSTTDSNRLIAMYIDAGKPMSERLWRIQHMDTNPPHDSAFAVSPGCPQSKTNRATHPLVMPAMMGLTKG